ncbi:hypothetical protein M0802_014320 [Mischocyttarus mexicanus]|nr:hypothetical protein M0802_014321 [Mischocyttarus mexicanus]KAI4479999.1 hypothetical protein M0802_014320 [Mischocyttarus mexicanus]
MKKEKKPDDPKFKEPIVNVTAPVGREAMLSCIVQDLAGYKTLGIAPNAPPSVDYFEDLNYRNIPIIMASYRVLDRALASPTNCVVVDVLLDTTLILPGILEFLPTTTLTFPPPPF